MLSLPPPPILFFLQFSRCYRFFFLEGSSYLSLFLSLSLSLSLPSFSSVTVDWYGLWVLLKVSEKLKVLPRQTSFKIYKKPTPYLLKHPI